jgi:hypothetical protein
LNHDQYGVYSGEYKWHETMINIEYIRVRTSGKKTNVTEGLHLGGGCMKNKKCEMPFRRTKIVTQYNP